MAHSTHETRLSGSSLYDERCMRCGATDAEGLAALERPCPAAVRTTTSEMAAAYDDALALLDRLNRLVREHGVPEADLRWIIGALTDAVADLDGLRARHPQEESAR